jgi:Domain of unknown function (DUF4394)
MRKEITSATMVLLAMTFSVASVEAQRGCGRGGGGSSLEIVGLTNDQRLICFRENNAANASAIGEVEGLTGDTRLVGIDFRPATGELYGLGNAGGLYILDLRNGNATFKSQLDMGLTGSSFDIDFNPTVDRLRVISNMGQNLRINVDTGAVTVDTNLVYTEAASGVTGAAYTNNDTDAGTGTTLFGIDSTLDQVVIQAPPNAGALNLTGKLGLDASADIGFDIYTRINGGSTGDVQAFASLISGDRTRLYKINLLTGKATSRGAFRSRDHVIDIAIPLRQR